LRFHEGVAPPFNKGRSVPKHVVINCVDPRVAPSRYAQLEVNQMFLMRNAGNLLPHNSTLHYGVAATEPAVLELAFTKFNTVRDVSVCGHSDCKAMRFLLSLRDDPAMFSLDVGARQHLPKHCNTPLRTWIVNHGARSLAQFLQLEAQQWRAPLTFTAESRGLQLEAWVDPENKWEPHDKLSMVNALLQTENVNSYAFMTPGLESAKYLLHTLWYDVMAEEVMVFSRKEKTYITVSEASTIELIMKEARETAEHLKKVQFSSNIDPEVVVANSEIVLAEHIKTMKEGAKSCNVHEYRHYRNVDQEASQSG